MAPLSRSGTQRWDLFSCASLMQHTATAVIKYLKAIFSPKKKTCSSFGLTIFFLSTDTFKKQLYTYIFIHTMYIQLFVLKINLLLTERTMDTQQQTKEQSANKVKGLQLVLTQKSWRILCVPTARAATLPSSSNPFQSETASSLGQEKYNAFICYVNYFIKSDTI